MRKLIFLTLLFLCISLSVTNVARAENINWCGTYFESNNNSFIAIAPTEMAKGSQFCSAEKYRTTSASKTVMLIDFNKNRSRVGNWRKFQNHVIEIRGKLRGTNRIINPRFVRDYGA